ncbi:hypothetical protein [Haloarcula marina]|uniref:hypothetical protein n=1 Tax=Haloarcula marina TaxID=2961574 RepID=UPI0020B7B034|nr:hypothetical protein [Halomicroarcula marina]
MNRRSYLALLSSALGAGCSASSADGDGTPDTPTGRSDTATPAEESTVETPPSPTETDEVGVGDSADTVETIPVGTREGVENPDDNRPHDVVVWNAANRPRELAVSIVARDGGPRVARRFRFAADAARRFELRTPVAYDVTVRVPVDGRQHSFEVGRNWFDCNSSGHRVRVPGTGPITATAGSTTLYCGEPATE